MKKSIIALLIALSMVLMPSVKAARVGDVPEKTDHEKVTIYLFWASWCPHCHDFIEYFSDKYSDYSDYFEIVTYRVNVGDDRTPNTTNSNLMQIVGEAVGETEGYLPLIIVGDWTQTGFGTDGSNIIDEALKAYQSSSYIDVVAETIKSKKADQDPTSFKDAMAVAGVTDKGTNESSEKKDNKETVIVIVVFAVLIGGFAGLIALSRKK